MTQARKKSTLTIGTPGCRSFSSTATKHATTCPRPYLVDIGTTVELFSSAASSGPPILAMATYLKYGGLAYYCRYKAGGYVCYVRRMRTWGKNVNTAEQG